MVSIEYDLRFYRSALTVLEKYLLSEDLYWPPPDLTPEREPPYQAMTLGSLLLSRKRLEGRNTTQVQQAEITRLDFDRDIISTRWRTAWQKKAEVEVRARINQWRNFIVDYREQPIAHADRLFTEARSRVMIELLMLDLPTEEFPNSYRDALLGLDSALKLRWKSGEFGWSSEIQHSFPEEPFWYLYGSLES